ncbi:MAG: hypothetical protein Q9162_004020 [Coniocarpon cinnabarinum]
MGVTLFSCIPRNPSLTHDQFKDIYENEHVPLLHQLFGETMPPVFKRTYIDSTQPTVLGRRVEFDLFTELVFEDDEAMNAMAAKWADPKVTEPCMASQRRFTSEEGERVVKVGEVRQ